MRGLEGKRVVVTGGTSGIGEATSRRFLDEGARVVALAVGEDEVATASERIPGIEALRCDVADADGGRRGVRAGRRAARRRRRARRERGHLDPQAVPRDRGGRLAARARRQPHRRLPLRAAGRAADGRAAAAA